MTECLTRARIVAMRKIDWGGAGQIPEALSQDRTGSFLSINRYFFLCFGRRRPKDGHTAHEPQTGFMQVTPIPSRHWQLESPARRRERREIIFLLEKFCGKMTSRLKPRRVTNEDRYPWLLTRFHPRVWHYRHNSNRDKPRRALAFSALSLRPRPARCCRPDVRAKQLDWGVRERLTAVQ